MRPPLCHLNRSVAAGVVVLVVGAVLLLLISILLGLIVVVIGLILIYFGRRAAARLAQGSAMPAPVPPATAMR